LLYEAREDIEEAGAWMDHAISKLEEELHDRDDHDTGIHGGEMDKAIKELRYLQSRIHRLLKEQRIIKRIIKEWKMEEDRLADMADGISV